MDVLKDLSSVLAAAGLQFPYLGVVLIGIGVVLVCVGIIVWHRAARQERGNNAGANAPPRIRGPEDTSASTPGGGAD